MKCPSCGAANTDEFQQCQKCGTYISPLYRQENDKSFAERLGRPVTRREDFNPGRIRASLRTIEPEIGGTIIILTSLGAFVLASLVYLKSIDIDDPYRLVPTSFVRQILLIISITSAIGIVGGAAAVTHRNYVMANLGCIAATASGFIIFPGFVFAAVIAWGLIADSRDSFKPARPGRDSSQASDVPNAEQ